MFSDAQNGNGYEFLPRLSDTPSSLLTTRNAFVITSALPLALGTRVPGKHETATRSSLHV